MEKKPSTKLASNPPEVAIRCPFIPRPLLQCYCYESNSTNIEAMIRYCGGEYLQCRIYLQNLPSHTNKGDNLE